MDVQTIDQIQAAPPAAAAQAAQPGAPAAPQQPPHVADETLHRALSHLVGGGSNVAVQFKVVHGTNQIVTVFTNKDTGEEISQFPAESMVLIAQFFNKLAGAVVDRTA
ncbi:MAG: flagellar protein FlaG [Candidatus Eremiobacteraeota bacterium]|nr:flagellar protein FlaG [Candidatus Eremiobacteraeota bacterium]